MIHIDRDPNPPPIRIYTEKTVKKPDGSKITKAQQELEKAIAFFTNPTNYKDNKKLSRKTFPFGIYKDADLAKVLEAVFGPKCAYCESRFAHVTPKDVEHYRPKSEIDSGGGALRPGYFWLAGEWSNLLVSCPDCNRSRNHEVPGQTEKVKLGKETQFPLKSEVERVRLHTAQIANEDPYRLLLDPCADNPEEHLTFDDKGLVYSRTNAVGQSSEKGKISIDVYALQRKGLVEERLQVMNDVIFQFDQLRSLVLDLNDMLGSAAGVQRVDEKRTQIGKVKSYMETRFAKDKPYLGMLRDYIRKTRASGGFDDLIQAGIDPQNWLLA